MIKCPQCGNVHNYDARACSLCGSTLLAPKGHFPVGLLVSLELVALALFGAFLWVMQSAGMRAPMPLLICSLLIAGLAPILARLVHARRMKAVEAYRVLCQERVAKEDTVTVEAVERRRSPYNHYAELVVLDRVIAGETESRRRWQQGELFDGREIIRRQHIDCVPDAAITLKELTEHLHAYAVTCGVELSIEDARGLLAAMSTSRLIVPDTGSPAATRCLVAMLSTFFNSNAHATTINGAWRNTWDLLTKHPYAEDDAVKPFGMTGALMDLYFARVYRDNVSVTLLQGGTPSSLRYLLHDFRDYIRNPAEEQALRLCDMPAKHSLRYFDGDKILVPQNLWFFFSPMHLAYEDRLTVNALGGVVVPLHIANIEKTYRPFNCVYAPVQADHMVNLLRQGEAEYFLPEDQWCRVDELSELLEASLNDTIGNRDRLHMETLSSIYLSLSQGNDPRQALAFALSMQVMPRLWSHYSREDLAAAGVIAWMEKALGAELTPGASVAAVSPDKRA